jgi:diguanylate cyclase (GGDEF)-like protein
MDGLLAQLQEAATTDTLTTLVNRRGLKERAPMLFSEAERSRGSIAVLLADIDHFKQYNDTHGHLRGDDVLRTHGTPAAQHRPTRRRRRPPGR